MKKDPIEKPLRELLADDEAPPFATMWARAQVQAEKKRTAIVSPLRLLVPGTVLAGVAALVFALYWTMNPSHSGSAGGSPDGVGTADSPPGLAKLVEIDPWTSVFEGLQSDWSIEAETTFEGEDFNLENRELAAVSSTSVSSAAEASGEGSLGEGVVYESPTDFLLQMEIPLWDES